jgi:hypothetical protein
MDFPASFKRVKRRGSPVRKLASFGAALHRLPDIGDLTMRVHPSKVATKARGERLRDLRLDQKAATHPSAVGISPGSII